MRRSPSTTRGRSQANETELVLRRIVRWPDAELLKVVTRERARYSDLVLNAAEAELRMRGVPVPAHALHAPVVKGSPALVKRQKNNWAQLVRPIVWLAYMLYVWTNDSDWWASKPVDWLLHGLIGAILAYLIIYVLFAGLDWLLRKLRHLP
jgi:hypothetical protein